MSEGLATELLEQVVEFVACDRTQDRTEDLLALCLSCKALVPGCQKHIFASVSLYPPVKDYRPQAWSAPPEYLKRYERTASFLRTVTRRPHLARHVQAIACNFTAQWLDDGVALCSNVLQAFENMINIKTLTLAYDDPYNRDTLLDFGSPSILISEWMVGIGSVIESPRLEGLTIRRLSDYPGEHILRSSHLHHLTLRRMKLALEVSL